MEVADEKKQKNDGKEEKSSLAKYLTVAVIYFGNVALGCAVNSIGPTLTAFQRKYNVHDSTISKVFIPAIICFMTAGVCSSFVYNRFNRQKVVILTFAVMLSIVFFIPHCPTVLVFFVAVSLLDFCAGFYDIAQLVWIPEMMQEKCAPYVQAQHFFFGLGTNISPLILAPFLDNGSTTGPIGSGVPALEGQVQGQRPVDATNLILPFSIIGAIVVLAMLLQMALHIFIPYTPSTNTPEAIEDPDSKDSKDSKVVSTTTSTWPWPKLRLTLLTCCFFASHLSCEVPMFKFFPKFMENGAIHLSQQQSAYVFTGMMTSFAVGRALGILIVLKLHPRIMLCANIVIVTCANFLLLLANTHESLPALWASSIIFGFGMSTTMALFTAYIERFLVITNTVGSLIVISGSVGAGLYEFIIGNFIQDNPMILNHLIWLSLFSMTVVFAVLNWLTRKDKRRYS